MPISTPAKICAASLCSMASMLGTNAATWGIAALATLGVIARPWNLPEFIWAIAGAALLVLFNLLPWPDALAAAAKGTDVYLFLFGMMLLAEIARAGRVVRLARGACAVRACATARPKRLFLLIYVVGTIVTVLLSNDATAVVLTPAVYAATRAAKVEAAALSVHLRLHRQCGELRAADFQSGQSRRIRQHDAAAGGLAADSSRCPRWSRSLRPIWCCASRSAVRSIQTSPTIDDTAPLTAARQDWRRSGSRRPRSCCSRLRRSGWQLGLPTFIAGATCTALFVLIATAVAVAGREGYFVVRAAAGGGPVRAGRGAQQDRRARRACGLLQRGERHAVAAGDRLDRRGSGRRGVATWPTICRSA